jgi:hypothetical protein
MRLHTGSRGTQSIIALWLALACGGALHHSPADDWAAHEKRGHGIVRADGIAEQVSSARNYLRSAQLDSVDGTSLSDAVRRLRPEWLEPHQAIDRGVPGSQHEWLWPAVYIGQRFAGGLEELKTIPLGSVTEVRFLGPTAGSALLGVSCPCAGGVIRVIVRPFGFP